MTNFVRTALFLAIFVAVVDFAVADFSCDPAPGVAGEDVHLSMIHDDVERTYTLHVPASYNCETAVPLLIGLHGYTGTGARLQNQYMQIFDHVEEHGYIAVFPDGLVANENAQWATNWNSYTDHSDEGPDGLTCDPEVTNQYPVFDNCPASEHERVCNWGRSCADDLGFVRGLIVELMTRYRVDPKRVYMTGHSMGAATVHGMGPELGDLLAAVAPMQGQAANGYSSGPESPVSYLHGWAREDDAVSPYGHVLSDGLIYDTAKEAIEAWAESQECSSDGNTTFPTPFDGEDGWFCTQHADCREGVSVVSCSWDGGHTWPKIGGDNRAWDLMWSFFMAHPKP